MNQDFLKVHKNTLVQFFLHVNLWCRPFCMCGGREGEKVSWRATLSKCGRVDTGTWQPCSDWIVVIIFFKIFYCCSCFCFLVHSLKNHAICILLSCLVKTLKIKDCMQMCIQKIVNDMSMSIEMWILIFQMLYVCFSLWSRAENASYSRHCFILRITFI